MKKLRAVFRRYRVFLLLLAVNLVLLFAAPGVGRAAFTGAWDSFLQMMAILPPIFILLGLLDVWTDRETMIRYMGHDAGLRGPVLAFLLGALAAGPLYAAFPIAVVLLKKGARLRNVFVFLGAWSTAKVPMLLFEASSLGLRFMLLRLGCNVIGIFLIAFLLEKTASEDEKKALRERAERL